MIVNLNLGGKQVLVIGGGKEAFKRVQYLVKENSKVLLISPKIDNQIKKFVEKNLIKYQKKEVKEVSCLSNYNPDLIITTTNNSDINKKIIDFSKKYKILVYSVDSPSESDFANMATIDIEKTIQIGIFTGGKSPLMSKKLKERLQPIIKKAINSEDLYQLKFQEISRNHSKLKIGSQDQRKLFLNKIMNDKKIKQLIKERQLKKAEEQIIRMLKDWK